MHEGNPTLVSNFEDSAYYLNSNLQLIWKVQGDAKHQQLASYLIGGCKASDSTAKKTYWIENRYAWTFSLVADCDLTTNFPQMITGNVLL